jgi:hypothetical protein
MLLLSDMAAVRLAQGEESGSQAGRRFSLLFRPRFFFRPAFWQIGFRAFSGWTLARIFAGASFGSQSPTIETTRAGNGRRFSTKDARLFGGCVVGVVSILHSYNVVVRRWRGVGWGVRDCLGERDDVYLFAQRKMTKKKENTSVPLEHSLRLFDPIAKSCEMLSLDFLILLGRRT